MATTADEHQRLNSRATAAVVLAVIVWGFGPILIRLTELPAVVLAFYRLWFGFFVTAGLLLLARRRLTGACVKASAPGGAFFGVNVAFFVSAVQRTSVAEVTLVSSFQPVLILFLAGRMFGETVGRREIGLSIASLAGVAVFEAGAASSPVWSLSGYLFAIAALVTFTGYYLASKRVREHLDAIEYMTGALLVAAIVITPIALVARAPLGALHGESWIWLALFVLGPGAGGHLLINWAHRYVDVTVSSLIVVGLPVVAAVLAWALLDEPLGALQLVGGTVVLVCVALIATRPSVVAEEPPV